MSETLPPIKDYAVEIDLWFLASSRLTDSQVRVYVLLKHFFKKGDKRRAALSISAPVLAEVMGLKKSVVEAALDRLRELGALTKRADENWDSIHNIRTDGREIAEALGFEVGPPPVKKLDTRVFFCRDVSDRAARLWAAATLKSLGDVAEAQGWTTSDQKAAADELAAVGLATYSVSKDGIEVVAKKMPKDGLRIIEFTSEELGKVGGSRPVLMATDERLRTEKQRRDRSRGLR